MKASSSSAHYQKIAKDIAARIACGELQEGSRIYGRSSMASEYAVSPETIRKAMTLLADQAVIEIKPQSGATVLSQARAATYLQDYEEGQHVRRLLGELLQLQTDYALLNQKMMDTLNELLSSKTFFSLQDAPLPRREIRLGAGCPLAGHSIAQLNFRHLTGCTIAAIRRGRSLLPSPTPDTLLLEQDVLVLTGTPEQIAQAAHYIEHAEQGGNL